MEEVPFQSMKVVPSAFISVTKPAPMKKEALYQPEAKVMPTLVPEASAAARMPSQDSACSAVTLVES